MPKPRKFADRTCGCGATFAPRGPRSRKCDDCAGAASNGTADHRAEETETPEHGDGTLNALDVIDAFGLDFNTGNAVRFFLEKSDGDELGNLQIARTYVDRAIARLEHA